MCYFPQLVKGFFSFRPWFCQSGLLKTSFPTLRATRDTVECYSFFKDIIVGTHYLPTPLDPCQNTTLKTMIAIPFKSHDPVNPVVAVVPP